GLPSRLKSPDAMLVLENPRAIGDAGVFENPPFPFPKKIVKSFDDSPITARSGLASRLKSAVTMARGLIPTLNGEPAGWLKLAPVQPAVGKIGSLAASCLLASGAISSRCACVLSGAKNNGAPDTVAAPIKITSRTIIGHQDEFVPERIIF